MTVLVTFEYKCRRCGKIVPALGLGITDESRAWDITNDVIHGKTHPDVEPTIVHPCEGGGAGICDLVGFNIKNLG